MLHQLPAASREKCAIAIKAYLEHFARNSNQLGLPVHGLELLRSRLFSATFGHYQARPIFCRNGQRNSASFCGQSGAIAHLFSLQKYATLFFWC
jgi:hypothetical protein